MSNLSQALSDMVARKSLKKGKLAKKSRLGKKQLNRILSGKERFVSNGDFRRLAKAVTMDELGQAHLLAARVLDVCNGPGKELVTVHVKGEPVKSAKTK